MSIKAVVISVFTAVPVFFLTNHAQAIDYRVDIGAGWAIGETDVDQSIDGYQTDGNVGTGSGPVASLSGWIDGLGYENLTLGLQYLFFHNSTEVKIKSPEGDKSRVDADLDVSNFMFNAAYRKNNGDIHPYGGVGVGVSIIGLEASGRNAITFPAFDDTQFTMTEVGPAGQVYLGCDIDIDDHWYAGASSRFFIAGAKFFGVDATTQQLMLTANAGYKF
ncbi:outer membrane beta-barrel protein [Defluviicoccus vanus]|uniref:Outer membrane beta-barrel protein n=1 Tax=Defluviicoccus vanus TaxID=111831 RepID=A0A7H1N396_9PROT|nr:outer membrane beta-barrel protein [Defluviicoccus vanus]QNT70182.1 outer membrane beta-barrel protein [Defluviicoccus vanus]